MTPTPAPSPAIGRLDDADHGDMRERTRHRFVDDRRVGARVRDQSSDAPLARIPRPDRNGHRSDTGIHDGRGRPPRNASAARPADRERVMNTTQYVSVNLTVRQASALIECLEY